MQNVLLTGNYRQKTEGNKVQKSEGNDLQNFSISKFTNALDHLPDGFVLIDTNLNFLYANSQAIKLLQRSSDDLIGKNFFEVFPDGKEIPFSRALTNAQETQATIILEGKNSPWGAQFKNYIYPSPDGICILISEIPEVKPAKESFANEIRLLSEAQRIANLGGWEFDVVTSKIHFSDEMYCLLGISPAAFTHTAESFLKLIHPEDREAVKTFLQELQVTGHSQVCNFRILSPDNTIRHLQSKGEAIFDENGKPVQIAGTTQNITERKQVEELLEETEEIFHKTFKFNPAAMLIISFPEGICVEANDSFLEYLEFSREELIGRSPIDLDMYCNPEYWMEIFQIFSEEGEVKNVELIVQTKSGKFLTGLVSIQHIRLKTKDYALIMAVNITERKRAEKDLQKSEERFRLLVENATDIFYQVALGKDPSERKLIFISPQAYETFGFEEINSPSSSDYINRYGSLKNSIHPDDISQVEKAAQILLANKIPVDREYRIWSLKANDYIWISDRITPRVDGQGKITGYQGIARNITEQKLSEKALQENRKRYQMISSIASDYMFESRLGSDGKFSLIWTAGAFGTITGYTMEEYNAVGGWRASLHPDDLVIDDHDQENLKANQSIISEIRTYKKDGSLAWVRVYAHPVMDEQTGKYIGVYGGVKDITERKLAEEEVKKQLAYQKAVNRISTILRGAQTLDEILPHLMEETLSMVETDTGAIWLFDNHTKYLHRNTSSGWFTQIKKPNLTIGEGIVGTVYQTGEAHISPEFAHDPLFNRSVFFEVPSAWGGICVPIRAETETIGALFIAVQVPRQLGEEDVRLLTTVSEIAGNAIHRARLQDQTQQQLKHLTTLHDIDHAISSTLDLHLLLDILLSHITLQLHVDAADILQYDPQTQTLEFAAGLGFISPASQKFHENIGEGHAGLAACERHIIGVSDNTITPDSECSRIKEIPEEGFVAHYALPLIVKDEVKGVLEVFHRSAINPENEWFDFLDTLAGQVAIAMDNATLFKSLQQSNLDLAVAYNATIEGWSRALDLRDNETENHTRRVTDLTLRLAYRMGINENKIVHIWRGALLHDIGKLGVPDKILLKPGNLTEEEWGIMERHPQLAYDMLYPIEYLRPALDIPYCHHEKWDGSGYPRGLKGSEIPLSARMFALADVFDALTSDRPYRKAWSYEKAIKYIREQSGMHFDPVLANVFTYLLRTGELGKAK